MIEERVNISADDLIEVMTTINTAVALQTYTCRKKHQSIKDHYKAMRLDKIMKRVYYSDILTTIDEEVRYTFLFEALI